MMNDADMNLRASVSISGDGGITVTTTGVTQLPAELNLRIPQGRDWDCYVTWYKGDKPVVMTGGTAQFVVRAVQGGTALLDLSGGAGIVMDARYMNITRTGAQTAALSFVRAKYNLNVTVGGHVIPLLEGFVDLDKSVMV